MSIIDFLFKCREQPQQEVDAGKLGVLHWSADDAAWKGMFNEIEFFVAPDGPRETMPGEALAYAESILMSLDWLKETLDIQKSNYASDKPQFKSELQNLGIESLDFSVHKTKGRYLNCQLGYGLSDRFWSADFHDRKFSGIGFDS